MLPNKRNPSIPFQTLAGWKSDPLRFYEREWQQNDNFFYVQTAVARPQQKTRVSSQLQQRLELVHAVAQMRSSENVRQIWTKVLWIIELLYCTSTTFLM